MDYIAIIEKAREITSALPREDTEYKPKLKENTLKNYKTQLNKMVKIFGENWWNEKTADEIVETILAFRNNKDKPMSQTYKRNLFQASSVLLTSLNKEEYKVLIERFKKEMWKLNKDYGKEHEDNPFDVISQNQKENMITYEELRDYIDRVKKDIDKEEILYMAYVILESLYWVPQRNEFAGMIYIGKREFNHLSQEQRKEHNYLVDSTASKGQPRKLTFVYYQDDTTTKTRPEEFQDLPKDLEKIWREYIRVMNYKKGDKVLDISRNHLSKILTQVSERYIGKRVSTTLIRKIKVFHFNGGKAGKEKKLEQIQLAKAMGHSVAVQDKIYNKA